MLDQVDISNYRGFRSYRLENLARVNLFVGKNNCGKTALLEGIQFLTTSGDPDVLGEAAERRGEVIAGRSQPPILYADIAHFFYGHRLESDASFAFSGKIGHARLTVKTIVAKNGGAEGTTPRPDNASTSGLILKISRGSNGNWDEPRFPISREGGVDFDVSARIRRSTGPQVRFVGSDSLSSVDLAVMWDDVVMGGRESDVADAMRVLEGNLESVRFLTGMLGKGMLASGYFPSRGGIVVGIKGQDGRIPLGSMGDGMRRLMALATSLAFTKESCLLVDEIDTGLHYSVMPDMWKLVITKAAAANTQVFATTHSWDCIEGLSLLCQSEPDLMSSVAIHKIDRAIPHSIAFSGESVVRMVKSHIDPR